MHIDKRNSNQPERQLTFALSSFAASRNTPDAPRSHFDGSEELLLTLVSENFSHAKPGYKEGVCLVPVPAAGFMCTTVKASQDLTLDTVFKPRREGEAPFLQVTTTGEKSPAQAVDIILYSRETLLDSGEESTGADWEVVTINARLTIEEEPMHPVTMARNFLELPGGSKGGDFSADDFAQAIIFWSEHVAVNPETECK